MELTLIGDCRVVISTLPGDRRRSGNAQESDGSNKKEEEQEEPSRRWVSLKNDLSAALAVHQHFRTKYFAILYSWGRWTVNVERNELILLCLELNIFYVTIW